MYKRQSHSTLRTSKSDYRNSDNKDVILNPKIFCKWIYLLFYLKSIMVYMNTNENDVMDVINGKMTR